jgi:hypothetical protein
MRTLQPQGDHPIIARKLVKDVVQVFAVTLGVSVVVGLIWNRLVHGPTTIDWETSFRFATLFAILFAIMPWIDARRSK